MTSLAEIGGLYQSIPTNLKDARTKAFAYACDKQIQRLLKCAEKTKVWCDIGKVNEKYLDYLAADSRALFYHSELAPDAKRELIINSPYWYMKLGTLTALEEFVTAVFGEGKVEEWFQYGGEPYHFRIHVTNANVSSGQNKMFKEMLRGIKRLSAQLEAIDYIVQDEFVAQVNVESGLRIISAFYPRYNTPPFLLDGRARLDGTYCLNGYLSGETLDFYPVVLRMVAGVDWRTKRTGTAGVQLFFHPEVQLDVENDTALRIWGAACAKAQTISRFFLQSSASAGTQTNGQLTMQSAAEERVDEEASVQIISETKVEIVQESALKMESFADCEVKTDGTLIVEKDLWMLDGSVMLDGSRILDAEIYEEKI